MPWSGGVSVWTTSEPGPPSSYALRASCVSMWFMLTRLLVCRMQNTLQNKCMDGSPTPMSNQCSQGHEYCSDLLAPHSHRGKKLKLEAELWGMKIRHCSAWPGGGGAGTISPITLRKFRFIPGGQGRLRGRKIFHYLLRFKGQLTPDNL